MVTETSKSHQANPTSHSVHSSSTLLSSTPQISIFHLHFPIFTSQSTPCQNASPQKIQKLESKRNLTSSKQHHNFTAWIKTTIQKILQIHTGVLETMNIILFSIASLMASGSWERKGYRKIWPTFEGSVELVFISRLKSEIESYGTDEEK